MAFNLKSESEVKEFIKNLGIEYRFGCYSEKKPEVCHLLADYLESIDKNYEKAAIVYKNTCDDYKYPKSCTKFATYSLLGKGTKSADYKTAFEYYEKGCDLNDADSCLHQGLLMVTDNKRHGLAQDVIRGVTTLDKSCQAGNANACYYLSGMYIAGVKNTSLNDDNKKDTSERNSNQYLLRQDMEKAFSYATLGCELGNMYSCANLSRMYARGDGVAKNPEMAQKFKNMALDMQSEVTGGQTLTFQEGLK